MGRIDPYFPKEISLRLATLANADIFIETGTFLVETTKWAAAKFKEVYTIELSEYLYTLIKDELPAYINIHPFLGDSRDVLPKILENKSGNIVFWLDGHWSGGETAGKNDPCPLLQELSILLQRKNDDIILIDDARLYNGKNNDEGRELWPSLLEIIKKVENESKNKRWITICDDQIYILPDSDEYKYVILPYILDKSIVLWEENYKKRAKKNRIKNSVKTAVVNLLKLIGLYKTVRKIYKSL